MNEREIIEYAVSFLLAFLICGIGVFIILLPQIDRLVEKWKKRRT
ncbi:MAG: hypothetical protein OXU50_02380 [Gammaproteobacteria bacterium]|nr:hypothetical protein [Gammaproteobacteria bacterium]